MRVRARRNLAATAAAIVLLAALPAGAAGGSGDGGCDAGRPSGTPGFVWCAPPGPPEEAAGTARDGRDGGGGLTDARPRGGHWYRCDPATGDACLPADAEGEAVANDEGAPVPEGYVEPGEEVPACDPPGDECFVVPGLAEPG